MYSLGDDADEAVVRAYAVEAANPVEATDNRSLRWSTVQQAVRGVTFEVSDDSGSVPVAPPRSTQVSRPSIESFVSPLSVAQWLVTGGVGVGETHVYFDVFPVVDSATAGDTAGPAHVTLLREAFSRDPTEFTLRYCERSVEAGDAVYVLGGATERDGETVIAPPESGGTFLLSARRL